GHLHQAEDAFLHARPARRVGRDQGRAPRSGALGCPRDLFAHHAAHAGAHERKVERYQLERHTFDRCAAADGRFALPAAPGGLGQLAAVGLTRGDEAQRVTGREVRVALEERAFVDQLRDAFARTQTRVVLAFVADLQIVFELAHVEQLAAA